MSFLFRILYTFFLTFVLAACSSVPSRPPEIRYPDVREPASELLPPGQPAKHIVFGVDGLLIQGIPASRVSEYNQSRVLRLSFRSFRVADHALRVIRRLAARPGVHVSMASEYTRAQTDEILNGLSALEPREPALRSILKTVLSREDLISNAEINRVPDPFRPQASAKNLRRISPDTANTILVDTALNAVAPTERVNLFYASRPFYAFENFDRALASRRDAQNSDPSFETNKIFFPQTEVEWRNHSQRMLMVFAVLQKTLDTIAEQPGESFLRLVAENATAPIEDQIRDGLLELSARYAWQVSAGRATGCSLLSETGVILRNVQLALCESALPKKVEWWGTRGNICASVTPDGGFLRAVAVHECVTKLAGFYLWTNREQNICGAFTNQFVLATVTETNRCQNRDVFYDVDREILVRILRDNRGAETLETVPNNINARRQALQGSCTEEFQPIHANDSSQKAYFEQLLRKGNSASLQEFLRLWYPERPASTEPSYIQRCQRQPWGALISVGNRLAPECSPDLLYSWGPRIKLEGIQRNAPDSGNWVNLIHNPPNPMAGRAPMLYATVSPVATHAYGLIPIRLKIKSGTTYNVVSSATATDNAVNYYHWPGQDFYIRNGTVVENWSFGTPEHYDEIVRDIQWISSNQTGIVYEGIPYGEGINRVLNLRAWDGFRGGAEPLKASLLEMIRMILAGDGRIYYQRGSCRNRERSFKVLKPTYFAPFKQEAEQPR